MNRYIIHCISEAHYEIKAESEAEARLQAEEWFMDRYPHITIESEDKNISCESCAYSDLDYYARAGSCDNCYKYDMWNPRE